MMQTEKDSLWVKLMKAGSKTGCHQLADRSFFFKHYQFPICARCTGVVLGWIIAHSTYICFFEWRVSLSTCLIMFMDWFIQYLGIRKSTNMRRLITGVFGGYGTSSIYLTAIIQLIQKSMQLIS